MNETLSVTPKAGFLPFFGKGKGYYGFKEVQISVRDNPVLPIEIKPFVGIEFRSPEQVFAVFRDLESLDQEAMIVLLLDGKNRIKAMVTATLGTVDSSGAHPREVFRAAIVNASKAVICVHNHPSGDPNPSPADISTTRKLAKSGEIIGIPLVDHIIIGKGRYFSFKKEGLL